MHQCHGNENRNETESEHDALNIHLNFTSNSSAFKSGWLILLLINILHPKFNQYFNI